MSLLTSFLGLFEWDTSDNTDLNSKFKINKALNENWNIIDSYCENFNTSITQNETNILKNTNDITSLKERTTNTETNIATLQSDSGHIIELSLNNNTYVLTATLKNKAGTVLNTSSVDFPVEELILDLDYDSTTKEIVITLKSGTVRRIPLADLISGLVSQDDFDELEDRVDDIEERQAEQNTAITQNANNIASLQEENADLQEQIKDKENNELKGTASGTSIDLSDSADSRVANIDSNGNSKQETTTYKGIMKVPKSLNQTVNGLQFIVNSDGSVTVKGTPTANTEINVELENPIVLNGTYTFSLKTVGTAPANSQQWILRKQDSTTAGLNPTVQSDTTNKVTKENLDVTASILRIFTNENKTFDCTVYPILEEGDTATDWDEAETHNTPNSDYEQPIKSCGEDINLFDKDNANILNANIGNNVINSSVNAKTLYMQCESNMTYTISRKAGQRFQVGETLDVPTIGATVSNVKVNQTGKEITIATSDSAKYLVVFYYLNGTDTLTEQEILDSIKIQKGTIATPWSPYGMGSISEKITNKNYYKLEDIQEKTQNEVTYSIKDGVIKLNGTATGGFNIFLNSQYSLKAGNYTMSAKVLNGSYSGGVIGKYVQDLDTSTQIIDGGLIDKTVHRTITQDYLKCRSYFYIGTGATFNNFEALVQLEAGEKASEAIPNQEQVYAIPTQQPMRSVGDVRDLFFKNVKVSKYYNKDLEENKWYERHNVARYFFTANSDIVKLDATKNTVFQLRNLSNLIKKPSSSSEIMTILSNYFIGNYSANMVWGNDMVGLGVNAAGNINIGIGLDKSATTAEELKSELISKGAYIDYPLAEPIDLPCTQEQIDALKELKKARTYKNVTHIYSEDEVEAVVDLTYVKDLQNYLDNIDTRLSALESEV